MLRPPPKVPLTIAPIPNIRPPVGGLPENMTWAKLLPTYVQVRDGPSPVLFGRKSLRFVVNIRWRGAKSWILLMAIYLTGLWRTPLIAWRLCILQHRPRSPLSKVPLRLALLTRRWTLDVAFRPESLSNPWLPSLTLLKTLVTPWP